MSFSSKVKNEVSNHFGNARHCNIAEISAIINMCGHIDRKYGNIVVKIQTENINVARKYYLLIKKTFNIDGEVSVKRSSQLKSNSIYSVVIKNTIEAEKVLMAAGIFTSYEDKIYISNYIDPLIIKKICCKRAYITGAFLSAGSVSNPEKTYHLEFVDVDYQHSLELQNLINYFDMDAKMIERKGHYVVYLKEGEKIVDLLNVIGAHISLMDLENLRIIKDMRNNVNRIVNCETANLSKTVSASIKQLSEIEYIQETIGLNSLPELLEEVARKRLMFPEASLKELGEMLSPTVGKSGVNHRLKKISVIAETIKQRV
jgi:DNA-binding protein WhiA